MSEIAYILFAGRYFEPNGGFDDAITVTSSRCLGPSDQENCPSGYDRVLEEAREMAQVSDFFYSGARGLPEGVPEAVYKRSSYRHIDWWHILEIGPRGIRLVARADARVASEGRCWDEEINLDGLTLAEES